MTLQLFEATHSLSKKKEEISQDSISHVTLATKFLPCSVAWHEVRVPHNQERIRLIISYNGYVYYSYAFYIYR